MANGFFQPKPNRFLLASQLFRQAPTTHWTGALAQALGGIAGGIGQRRQQADIARQQQEFQQAITGMLPQAQQPTAIPAQPMAQDLSPMGQALSGLAETGGRPDMIPAGQQAQAVGITPQPTPAGIPAQPQPQQGVAGGLSPQVISQLIAGGQPQLAMQLVGQAKARQQQLADVAGGRAFETGKIQQAQTFQKELIDTKFQQQKELFNLEANLSKNLARQNASQVANNPFSTELQKQRAKSLVKSEEKLDEARSIMKQVGNEIAQAEKALPDAITGFGTAQRVGVSRVPIVGKFISGVSEKEQVATRTVSRALKNAVALVLKASFGAQLSDAERNFMEEIQGKSTFSKAEIERALQLIRREYSIKLQSAQERVTGVQQRIMGMQGQPLPSIAPAQEQAQPQVAQPVQSGNLKGKFGLRE